MLSKQRWWLPSMLGGGPGCLAMVLISIVLSVVLTVALNLALRLF